MAWVEAMACATALRIQLSSFDAISSTHETMSDGVFSKDRG